MMMIVGYVVETMVLSLERGVVLSIDPMNENVWSSNGLNYVHSLSLSKISDRWLVGWLVGWFLVVCFGTLCVCGAEWDGRRGLNLPSLFFLYWHWWFVCVAVCCHIIVIDRAV